MLKYDPEPSRDTVRCVLGFIAAQRPRTADLAWAVLASMADRRHDPSRRFPLLQTVVITLAELRERLEGRDERVLGAEEAVRRFRDLSRRQLDLPAYPIPLRMRMVGASADVPARLFDVAAAGDPRRAGEEGSREWLVRGGQWAFWALDDNGRRLLCRLGDLMLSGSRDVAVLAVELAVRSSLDGRNAGAPTVAEAVRLLNPDGGDPASTPPADKLAAAVDLLSARFATERDPATTGVE